MERKLRKNLALMTAFVLIAGGVFGTTSLNARATGGDGTRTSSFEWNYVGSDESAKIDRVEYKRTGGEWQTIDRGDNLSLSDNETFSVRVVLKEPDKYKTAVASGEAFLDYVKKDNASVEAPYKYTGSVTTPSSDYVEALCSDAGISITFKPGEHSEDLLNAGNACMRLQFNIEDEIADFFCGPDGIYKEFDINPGTETFIYITPIPSTGELGKITRVGCFFDDRDQGVSISIIGINGTEVFQETIFRFRGLSLDERLLGDMTGKKAIYEYDTNLVDRSGTLVRTFTVRIVKDVEDDEDESPVKDETPVSFVKLAICNAVATNGIAELYDTDSLSYDEMEFLKKFPNVTLILNYEYNGKAYRVAIKGQDVYTDETIPVYGPLCLAEMFGNIIGNDIAYKPNSGRFIYVIKKGDTLRDIAQRYNTSVARLLALNPYIKNKDCIYEGKTLIIED